MMFGLDEAIASLGGGGVWVAVFIGLLLGVRHATDPDHLAAVSTLVLAERSPLARRAGALGLAWGLGHALTLFALGLPLVLFGHILPELAQRIAEFAVGVLIIALAIRLLLRWRRGHFHAHPHSHGTLRHSHPHFHEHRAQGAHASEHEHRHAESLGRSPLAAFGIGLVHGVGGSAGAGLLLVAAARDTGDAILALVFFALGTALSMAVVSGLFGHAMLRVSLARHITRVVPAFATVSLMFGIWYALGALELAPYGF